MIQVLKAAQAHTIAKQKITSPRPPKTAKSLTEHDETKYHDVATEARI